MCNLNRTEFHGAIFLVSLLLKSPTIQKMSLNHVGEKLGRTCASILKWICKMWGWLQAKVPQASFLLFQLLILTCVLSQKTFRTYVIRKYIIWNLKSITQPFNFACHIHIPSSSNRGSKGQNHSDLQWQNLVKTSPIIIMRQFQTTIYNLNTLFLQ